jgi:hypothetical protein
MLDFLTLEDGTDRLSRNVGTELPLNAALYPRRAQISSTWRRKPEITHTYILSYIKVFVQSVFVKNSITFDFVQ